MEVIELAKKLIESEAACPDLALRYTIRSMVLSAKTPWLHFVEGFWARLSSGKLRLDCKVYKCDLESDNRQLIADFSVVYDGSQTISLNRNFVRNGEKLSSASIQDGLAAGSFDHRYIPHHMLWYTGASTFGQVLMQHRAKFLIAGTSEPLSGYSALKAAGYICNDAVTMTLWSCPDLAFAPLKIQLATAFDRKPAGLCEFSDFAPLPSGRFYPKYLRTGDPDPASARVCQISKIWTDPPDRIFSLALPPGTRVYNPATGQRYTA